MQEFAIKGLELNCRDAEIRKSSISRIAVEGYDTSLRWEDVDGDLREHFDSCGNIIHVYVPINEESDIICRYAFIYVNEEDEEKALRLDGSVMGGRILKIKSYPFHENHLDDYLAPMEEDKAYRPQHTIMVTGYDTSLPTDVIEKELEKHFSAVGSFVFRDVTPSGASITRARINVRGQEGVEKALKRSGLSVGGFNCVVTRVVPLEKNPRPTGYRHPHNLTILTKEQIEAPNIYFVYDRTDPTAGDQKKKKKKSKTRGTSQKKKKRKERKLKKSETRDGNHKMKGV